MIDIPGVKVIKKTPIYEKSNDIGWFIAIVWIIAVFTGIFTGSFAGTFSPIGIGIGNAIVLGVAGTCLGFIKPNQKFKHTKYTLEISDEANFNQVNSHFKSLWNDNKDIWYAIPRVEEDKGE